MSGEALTSAPLHAGRALPTHRQQGISLVEMMISLVLGLILIAALYNMYTGNVRSARFTEGVQAIQENGRYAVSTLQRGLRLAGYSPIIGVDAEIEAIDISNSDATKLTIRTRQGFDCNGLETSETDGLAVNTYRLDSDTNELTCKGNQLASTDMAVVEGVDEFRLLYGVDEDGDDTTCVPQRYIPYNDSIKSSEVVALRFAFLVNSGTPIRTRNETQTFVLLDKEIQSANDRLVREVFSGTVLLRNNISCAEI